MRRYFFLICVCAILYAPASGQVLSNAFPRDYDILKQRLLAISAGKYIYNVSQGQIDQDSAMLLGCRIYGLNRLLPYNEGYRNGPALPGEALIDAGKIREVKKLLDKAHGVDRMSLLLQLGVYYLFKPGTGKTDLDSAYVFIQQARALATSPGSSKWENETLDLLGKYYHQAGNFPESQKYFSQVTQTCRETGDEAGLALALQNQAMHLPYGDPAKLNYLERSLELYKKLKRKEKEIEVFSEIITAHFISDFSKAEKELPQILELLKSIGFRHRQYVHNVISFIADYKSDFVNALSHAEQTIECMNATGDTVLSGLYYMRLGTVYMHLGKIEQALEWLHKPLAARTRETQLFWYKSFLLEAQLLSSLSRAADALVLIEEITSGFPPLTPFDKMHLASTKATCYEYMGQHDLAEQNYAAFAVMAEHFPPQYVYGEMPEAYYRASSFYFKQGDAKKAKHYLQKALGFASAKGAILNLININQMLFKLDSAEGNLLSAIRHYQQFKIFSDSFNNISQRKQVEELMVKYETGKKDQNIESLTNESNLQQAKLERANLVRNITFGGVALLLVIVGLLYNQYRLKQRAGSETLTKNVALQRLVDEKEWLLKEIHHRVKNNLQTVVSLLESQSAYLQDDALLAIQDSQNRVYAMSLIHQKLYQGENVASIDMGTYLPELVNYLREGFNVRQKIHFNLEIIPVELDVSQAVPVGLIVNEAITNSIKYAFPADSHENIITVRMERTENNQVTLTVSDNGAGFAADSGYSKSPGLGLKLMKGLTGDIQGRFTIESRNGTTISVSFTVNTPLHKAREATVSKSTSATA